MPPLMSLTPRTLEQLGDQFGIHYVHEGQGAAIARGRVSDLAPSPGLHITLSDLDVQQRYLSHSTRTVPWFLSVVIDGVIHVQQQCQRLRIGPGQGFCAHFTPQTPLVVEQPAQHRLRTLNVAVLSEAPYGLPTSSAPQLSTWELPTALFTQLQSLSQRPLDDWRCSLVWQGLALQLLGHGLPTGVDRQGDGVAKRPAANERLHQLHQALSDQPMVDYSLTELARQVAMSPSSLREKFRAQFGYSVFAHIRQCRLQRGYAALARGESIQQVAHACGYRQASNFATAFKRQFGVPPTALTR